MIVFRSLAYRDYEGIALSLEERQRLVADLGEKHMMLLRNHGSLAVGATAAEAWANIYYLEKACVQQIGALSAGRTERCADIPLVRQIADESGEFNRSDLHRCAGTHQPIGRLILQVRIRNAEQFLIALVRGIELKIDDFSLPSGRR